MRILLVSTLDSSLDHINEDDINLQNSTLNCAACMFVGVGSLKDPENIYSSNVPKEKIDGMAHFCEHMLFLGSKKYPELNYL